MAKTPFTHSLTPEQQAQLLKAREHSLGSADTSQPAETLIAWEIQLKAQPMPAQEAEPASAPHALANEPLIPASRQPANPMAEGASSLPADMPQRSADTATPALPAGGYIQAPDVPDLGASRVSNPPGPIASHSARLEPSDQPPSAHAIGGGAAGGKASAAAQAATTVTHGMDGGSTASGANPLPATPGSATIPGSTTPPGGATAPVATFQAQGTTSGQVKEDLQLHTQGALTISGQPSGPLQWDVANRQGLLGALDIDQNGQWHYLLDNANPKVQALGEGQQVAERFLVFATDASGVTRAVHLLVQVNGSNDRAVIAGTTLGSVTEETQLHTGGQLSVTDADSGQATFVPIASAAGLHGQFALAADGRWDYQLDPKDPTVDALKHGEQLTETFTVTSKDGTAQQITVTIHGSDDKAVIAGTAVGTVTDASQPGFAGKLTITDPDAGQAEFVPQQQAAASHGVFSVAADGSWSYHLSSSDTAVQALRPGDAPLVDTLTVTSKDGGSTQTLSVFIHGSNDAPTLQATRQLTHEDDPLLHGRLIGHDLDRSDTLVYGAPASVPGFTLHADGSYTFDPANPAWQHFCAGEQHLLEIPVTVTDEAGARATQTLQIIITGSNDLPLMQLLPPMATFEGSAVLHGKLAAIDIDTHDTLTFRATQPVAGFTLNADGSYRFDPNDPAYNQLAFGQKQIVSIPVEVVDSAGGVVASRLQITVTGTNDTPTLTVQPPRHVSEGAAAIHGQLAASDPDSGDTLTYSAGQHVAGFTLNADGSYSFDPSDNAYNYLPAGQKAIVSVPLIVTDPHGGSDIQQLQITVLGTNDAPIVGGIDHAMGAVAGAQGGRIHIAGQLSALDLDQGESHFQAQLLTGTYGVLEITPDGHWSYSADATSPALATLPANGHLPEHFTVRTADGSTHDIEIQIKGSNTPAIFAGVSSGMISEDQAGSISHHLTVSDPNAGESAFTPVDQGTQYGHFTLLATGDWSYTLDNSNPAVQALTQGASMSERITVGSIDGTPTVITVVIMGTDDRAIISGTHSGDVIEDNVGSGTTLTTSGRLSVTDPDANQEHFIAMQNIAGDHGYGSFSVNVRGHWTYSTDNTQTKVQALKDGETVTDSFSVMTADGTQQTITVTLTGTNDKAVIGGVDTGNITEDVNMGSGSASNHGAQPIHIAAGRLTVTDVDAGEAARFPAQRIPGTQGFGVFALLPDGRWQYGTNQNSYGTIQSLKAGDTLTDSAVIHSTDGTTHTITVTIHGTNDVPMLQAQTQSVTEDGQQLSGQMVATDVDAGDTQAFSLANSVDGFTLNPDGSYTFDPNNAAYQHLAVGQTQDVTIPVTVTDSQGAQTTENLTITVTGSNDGPVVSGAVSLGAGTEDTAVTLTKAQLLANATDIDSGDLAQLSIHNVVADHGTVTDNGDGTFTFHPEANYNGPVQFSYNVQDPQGASAAATATLNLSAVADAATFSGQDTGGVKEDIRVSTAPEHYLTASGVLVVHDPDAGQDHFQFNSRGEHAISDPFGGWLRVDQSGNWEYFVSNDNPALQRLAEGQTQDVIYEVRSADGTAHRIVVTVTGTNDAPVLQAQAQSVAEDGQVLSGQMHATDVDTGDTQAFSLANPVAGFTLNADGSYQFDPSHASYQHLAAGQTQDVVIPVTVTDSAGVTSTQTLTITVTGTNDKAVIAGVDTGSVTEDVDLVAGTVVSGVTPLHTVAGRLTVTDVDAGEAARFPLQRTPGAQGYGVFALLPDGHWQYTTKSNSNPTIQALKAGDTLTDSAVIHSADGTTHTITVTIHGTNDEPVLAAQTQAVAEDGARLSGQMVATDVDAGDTQAFSLANSVAGFTLNPDGSYSFDPAHASYQHLAAGQTQDVVIPITVTDSAGATSKQNLTITVTGVNDAAIIGGGSNGTITEDQGVDATHTLNCGGRLVVADIDTGEATFAVQHGNGANGYGSFVLGPSGTWTYTADNTQTAIQQLKAGQSLSDSVTVSSADGTTHTITVTIQGTNDAPVLAAQTQAVTEDGTQLSGKMVATDVDSGDSQTFSNANAVDGFTLNADGSYSFDPSHASYQHLAAGHTQTLTIPVTVTDAAGASSTQDLVLNIRGSNDGAVISGTDRGDVTEDVDLSHAGKITASGTLSVSDPDVGEAVFAVQTGPSAQGYGGFVLGSSGTWTYAADNANPAIQALKAGDTLTDSFSVHSADGTTHTVNVTIHGSNDGAVISGTDRGDVTEDVDLSHAGKITASGTLSVSDPDVGEAVFAVQTGPSAQGYGGFVLGPSGTWTYAADNANPAIQALKAGDTLTDSFTVTSADGTAHTVTVTIQGSNDAPSLLVRSHAVAEDGTRVTGNVRVDDVDTGDTHSFSLAHPVAGFTLNVDGSYSFDPSDAAYQHLAQGQRLNVAIDITVTDGSGASDTQPLFITVTGSNDGAVVSGVDSGRVGEDATLTTGGQLTVTDIDDNQAVFAAQTNVAGTYGSFSLATDGTWTYTLDNTKSDVQALRAGETRTENFVVASADGTTHTVTVTVTGANDGSVIAGVDTGAVSEDGILNASGQLSITDPDAGQAAFMASPRTAGRHGVFTFAADGHWTYALNNSDTDVQSLVTGRSLTDSLSVRSVDGSTHTITVTIQGRDDVAVITGVDTGRVTEDRNLVAGLLQTQGQLSLIDADAAQAHFLAQNQVAGQYGTFSVNIYGLWTYTADNRQTAVQGLNSGDTLTDSFTVQSADGTSHIVAVTIAGTNDSPDLLVRSHAVVEDGSRLTGQVRIDDPDTGDTHNVSTITSVAGFTLNADGSYSFDPGDAAYQHLAQGQRLTLNIPITVTDSQGASSTQPLTIVLTGSNDGALIAGTDRGAVTEDTQLSASGRLTVSDIDDAQAVFQPQIAVTGSHGSFTLAADGRWTYQLNDADPAVQALNAGQTLTDRLTARSADGTSHGISIVINGVDDGAHLIAQSRSISEDGAMLSGRLNLSGSAAASGYTFSLAKPIAGLYVDPDGSYGFSTSYPEYQHLRDGQLLLKDVPITITDSQGHAVTEVGLKLTIVGANDGARITGDDYDTLTEDHNVQTGQLQARGHLKIDDIDLGQEHFVAQQGLHGQYGTLDIDVHGQWHYSADNSQAAIQNLNAGQSISDTITVQSVDGTRHNIVVTVGGVDEPVPPALQGPALIVAPPTNHVLQPHMTQSGDIYQQLIDTFLATNDPAYIAVALAMQHGDPYGTLSNVELVIDGAGILITDASGSVSTKIPPNSSGTSAIPLNVLINLNINQGTWIQLFDPQDPSHEVKPWLHNFYEDANLKVDYLGHQYVNHNAHGTVSQPISVPFYAPPGGAFPAPAPAPSAGTDQQHDDPSAFLGDSSGGQDAVVISADHPTATGHAADGTAQPDHAPSGSDGATPEAAYATPDIAPLTSTALAPTSPADDYLQFAAAVQHVGPDGAAAAGDTPVDHYLAVAGVDPVSVVQHTPDLPPTDVLLDIHQAADSVAAPDQQAVDDAALAAVSAEVPHQPNEDPQHRDT